MLNCCWSTVSPPLFVNAISPIQLPAFASVAWLVPETVNSIIPFDLLENVAFIVAPTCVPSGLYIFTVEPAYTVLLLRSFASPVSGSNMVSCSDFVVPTFTVNVTPKSCLLVLLDYCPHLLNCPRHY